MSNRIDITKAAQQGLPRLKKVIADDGCSRQPMIDFVTKSYGWQFETKKRTDIVNGKVQHRRWKAERTIGWTMNGRSLCRHYEYDSRVSETKVLLVSVYYISKRLTDKKTMPYAIAPNIEKKLLLHLNQTA